MPKFDISPECEATFTRFLYRQLFVRPPPIPRDVNLRDKTVIVTGSNSGIGLECARYLIDLEVGKLILAVRNESSGEAARADLSAGRNLKDGTIEVWKLDYLSYDSILAFAKRSQTLDRLDIVILNAGRFRTSMCINPSTGHEEDVQVNYLSTALLCILLLPVFKAMNSAQSPGRLVLVSSDTAAWSKFKERNSDPLLPAFDKPQEKFDFSERYSVSKLLTQLFLVELARRVPSSVVVINTANPGFCRGSGLGRDANGTYLGILASVNFRLLGRLPDIGARNIVDAALRHGAETHGEYLEDGKLTPMAPIVYKAEAEPIIQKLWKETMSELEFSDAEGVISSFSK